MAEGQYQTIQLPIETSFMEVTEALQGKSFFSKCKCPFCGEFITDVELLPIDGSMKMIMVTAKDLYELNVVVSDCLGICMNTIADYAMQAVSDSTCDFPESLPIDMLQKKTIAGQETQILLHRIEQRLEDLLVWAFKMDTAKSSELLIKLLSETNAWVRHLVGEVATLYSLLCVEQPREHQDEMASLQFEKLSLN